MNEGVADLVAQIELLEAVGVVGFMRMTQHETDTCPPVTICDTAALAVL